VIDVSFCHGLEFLSSVGVKYGALGYYSPTHRSLFGHFPYLTYIYIIYNIYYIIAIMDIYMHPIMSFLKRTKKMDRGFPVLAIHSSQMLNKRVINDI
tara:strand:+ start:2777 stop:3067 length:291 start_codon:yes stop_codon:yes gene_type:complete